MYCTNCGKEISEASKFCKYCGTDQKHCDKKNEVFTYDLSIGDESDFNEKLKEKQKEWFFTTLIIILVLVLFVFIFKKTHKPNSYLKDFIDDSNSEMENLYHERQAEDAIFMNEIEKDLESGELDPSIFYD